MLSLRSIRKRYGNFTVLNGISFDIAKGEVAVLLGPNGAGKTTLLNIIAGLIEPDAGAVIIDGNVVFEKFDRVKVYVPPERRNIGYVPQDFALFPHLTVYENIAFGLRARKLPEDYIRCRVKELIDILGLNGLEHKHPHKLSSGEKQKIALARALAPKPKLLLLDEPLSSIDPSFKEAIREELKKYLKKFKITTLIVTHDLNDAWSIANRVLVLLKGRIVCDITLSNMLLNNTVITSENAAEFLGLNFLKGKVLKKIGDYLLIQCDVLDVELIAFNRGNVKVGDKVLITFRPDDVIIHGKACLSKAKNSMEAVVENIQVAKCNIKIKLKLYSNIVVNAEVSRGYIVTILNRIRKGSRVQIHIPPKCINVCKL